MKLLEFNDIKFHAIELEGRIGFLNTEIYKVLELPYMECIPRFLKNRNNIDNKENDDYLILQNDKAYRFKALMRLNGINNCNFRKSFIIYETGIVKFLNEYANERTEEFKKYLFEHIIAIYEQKFNQIEPDLVNIESDVENVHHKESNKKRIDQMYSVIEIFNKSNLPDKIKIQYVSSLLAREGIIDNKILNQTKEWMKTNTINITNDKIF